MHKIDKYNAFLSQHFVKLFYIKGFSFTQNTKITLMLKTDEN